MTADLARLLAAQEMADRIVAAIGESPDGVLLLRVAVTDDATGQRLATCFVNVEVDAPVLRLVGEAP